MSTCPNIHHDINLPGFFGESVVAADSSFQVSRDFTVCFFADKVALWCGFWALGGPETEVDLLVVTVCVVGVPVVVVVEVVKESGVAVLVVIILSVSQDSWLGCFVMVSLFSFGAVLAVVWRSLDWVSCCLGVWSSIIKSTEPSPLTTSAVPAVED